VVNTLANYSDDNATREALRKVESERTLHEIYGLFYGAIAAPKVADPAQYVTMIFDVDSAGDASEEVSAEVHANLMSLWNFIARWNPEEEPFYFPETDYPDTAQGMRQRAHDNISMINYFITGLKLGGTEETDFSEDAIDAMHALAEASTLLQKEAEAKKTADPKASAELQEDLEEFMADSFARVTIGLKDAKVQ
jgi:uncharacterized protein YgfB (UPF0149 family)